MAQKINNKAGIRDTFAELPDLKKVHITSDGRHYFDESHAKSANGYTEKKDDKGKLQREAKKVEYKTFERDAKELQDDAPAA